MTRHGSAAGDATLPPDVAVAAQSLTKVYSSSHEARYRPAVSIFSMLRERRLSGSGAPPPSEPLDVDEDADEDDTYFSDGEESGAPLFDVGFEVRRGEAVRIAGSAGEERTVARILCGMTGPTAGRILVRGRVAPSIELATLLASRELTAKSVARRLAALTCADRRQRGSFVRGALELALGDARDQARTARPSRQLLHRVAASAAFDPTADVLVIDGVSDLGDDGFVQRCRQRLVERLGAGASVVLAGPAPPEIEGLCARAVYLEDGRVVETWRREPDAASAAPPPAPSPRSKPALSMSNEHLELHSAAVFDLGGRVADELRQDDAAAVRMAFSVITPGPAKLVVRFMGREIFNFTHEVHLHEGDYVSSLALPGGTLSPGDYSVAVSVIVEGGGRRFKVGSRDAARVHVLGNDDTVVLAAETGAVFAVPVERSVEDAVWEVDRLSR